MAHKRYINADLEFTIDHDIPLPPKRTGRTVNYPYEEMEVGDSFAVPNLAGVQSAYAANKRYRDRYYCTRKLPEGGYRVWRTA